MSRVPFHVVGGFLGTGKTTAVRDLLARRSGTERAAVVVNDFGEAAIDATVMGGEGTGLVNIAGGCVCCTAPEGLVDAVRSLLDTVRPDRIYIEPSGLAHPSDVVDMLSRGALASRLERQPLIVLVDPAAPVDTHRMSHLLDGADVVVLNRSDLADPAALARARVQVAGRWPAPMLVVETSHGVLPESALGWARGHGPRAIETPHDHDHHHEGSTVGFHARSWVLPPDLVLAYDQVRSLAEMSGLSRLKGLFHTDLGWFRVDRAGGRVHLEPTPWRRDSRIDAVAEDVSTLTEVAARLDAASRPAAAPTDGVRLEAISGEVHVLDRARLAALPGQVPDVSVVVAGREGTGVYLREVLALASPPPEARFVVVAADGLTTAPVPVGGAGEAVLLYALTGGGLPAGQGGPYRILGPSGAGRTACANVKGVVRLRVLPPDAAG